MKTFFYSRGRLAACLITSIVFLSTAGCSDDDSVTPLNLAYVSFYHASPDLEEIDIYAGSSNQVNQDPVDFQDFLAYKSFNTGERTLKFTEEGDDDAIMDTTFTFSRNKFYSVFIADSLESVEAVVFVDSTESPSEGHAMIRFIHMSPDAQAVEVLLNDEVLFEERSFKTGTAFKEIEEGSWGFQLRDANQTVIYTSESLDIEEDKIYTIILTGFVDTPEGNENELNLDIIEN